MNSKYTKVTITSTLITACTRTCNRYIRYSNAFHQRSLTHLIIHCHFYFWSTWEFLCCIYFEVLFCSVFYLSSLPFLPSAIDQQRGRYVVLLLCIDFCFKVVLGMFKPAETLKKCVLIHFLVLLCVEFVRIGVIMNRNWTMTIVRSRPRASVPVSSAAGGLSMVRGGGGAPSTHATCCSASICLAVY